MRLPGAFRVTGWQEDEMVELGTAQAVRLVVLHEEQVVAGRGAAGARPLVQRRDDDQVRRLARGSAQPLRLSGGEVGRHPVRAVGPFDLGLTTDAEP
jgi:hypothetical protein